MLVGEPPFTGPSVQAIVGRLLSEEPRSIIGQRKAVGAGVESAVLRALEKLPADRFATAHEFAEALSHSTASAIAPTGAATLPTTGARIEIGTGRRRSTLIPMAGALLAGGILAGTAVWSAASHHGDSPSISFALESPISAGVREPTSNVRVSPDGETLTFIVEGDTNKLYVRSLGDVNGHLLPAAAGVLSYAFSPDSRRIAVASVDGKLRIVPLDGGPSVTIADLPHPWSGVAWADNRTIVAGNQPTGAGSWLIATTGGSPRQVFRAKPTFTHGLPFVDDDGETAFFLDWGPGFTEDDYLAIGSLKTGAYETSKLLAQG